MGVRRAEEKAKKAAQRAMKSGKPVFTYGPLIHNPQAVRALEDLGVKVLDPEAFERGELDEKANNSIVVIRAHGAPPEALERLGSLDAEIVDATCPRVLKSQKKAASLIEKGYSLAIAIVPPEVTGILGYAPGQGSAERRRGGCSCQGMGTQVALIAQTTIKKSEYDAIATSLKPTVLVFSLRHPALPTLNAKSP